MKLYVDDMRVCPAGWEVARTAEEAIRKIATFPGWIEAISLDHDAGAESRDPDSTFQSVAYFIGEKYRNALARAIPRIYLHTNNPRGREVLKNILWSYQITTEDDKPAPAAEALPPDPSL